MALSFVPKAGNNEGTIAGVS